MQISAALGACAAVAAVAALILSRRGSRGSDGFVFFFYPFAPSALFAACELARALAAAAGAEAAADRASSVASFVRLAIGLGWFAFSARQYLLNGVDCFVPRAFPAVTVATAANIALHAFDEATNRSFALAGFAVSVVSAATLLYAAFAAFYVLSRKNRLHRSTWAGIAAAGYSLVVYPFMGIADVFRFHYPLIDEAYPAWMQLHPWYLISLCLLVVPFLLIPSPSEAASTVPAASEPLSRREEEAIVLLREGLSYKEAADRMFVSVSTIKSHVNRAYGKLGIHSRSSLAARDGLPPQDDSACSDS